MRIVFINDVRPHAHSYGIDFLIQAAYHLGWEVWEVPLQDHLHLEPLQRRDACAIDSDAWIPRPRMDLQSGPVDAIVVTAAYGRAPAWDAFTRLSPQREPIIGLCYEDEPHDTSALLRAMCGRLDAYYHREGPLPPGAFKLWLSQPRSRMRPVAYKPNLWPVFYSGAMHGDQGVDPQQAPRRRMIESIRTHVPGAVLAQQVQQTDRLTPEEYRERLWQAAISPIWNSSPTFPVWDCNRFWESCALGCAIVAEIPKDRLVPFVEGVVWVEQPEAVGPACAELLAHPRELRERQEAIQARFRDDHTSEARLAQIIAGRPCPMDMV